MLSSGASLQWPHAKSVFPLIPLDVDMEIEGSDDWVVEGVLFEVLPCWEAILQTYSKSNQTNMMNKRLHKLEVVLAVCNAYEKTWINNVTAYFRRKDALIMFN
jgi:hypothetical protein